MFRLMVEKMIPDWPWKQSGKTHITTHPGSNVRTLLCLCAYERLRACISKIKNKQQQQHRAVASLFQALR